MFVCTYEREKEFNRVQQQDHMRVRFIISSYTKCNQCDHLHFLFSPNYLVLAVKTVLLQITIVSNSLLLHICWDQFDVRRRVLEWYVVKSPA